jgi:hypothetical protein
MERELWQPFGGRGQLLNDASVMLYICASL